MKWTGQNSYIIALDRALFGIVAAVALVILVVLFVFAFIVYPLLALKQNGVLPAPIP